MADSADTKIYPVNFPSGSGPGGHVNSAKTAIEIYHLISGATIKFIPFITEFSDTHSSEWSQEQVYGRMDDLLSFQRTRRSIRIGFDCPSESEDTALMNFKNLSLLKQFLYPRYAGSNNALSLKGAPLFRVKLLNFINSLNEGGEGLLCKIGDVSFSPSMDAGFYIVNQNTGAPQNINNVIVPKQFSVGFEMLVLHEFTPRWKDGEGFDRSFYPYNLQSPMANVEANGNKKGIATNPADKPIDIAQTAKILAK